MDRFRKLSLIKQILSLILIMLIILLISFVISNKIAERIIEKKVTDSVSKILLQVEEKMVSFYLDMEGISTSLLYSPTVQTFMSSNDPLSMILMNNEIISVFSNTIMLKENIRGIQLYDKEGAKIANIGAGTGESVKPPVDAVTYSGLLTNPGTNTTSTYYSITVPIYNLKSTVLKDYRGTSVFVMDINNFSNILASGKITRSSRLLLLDQNNKIMANEGNPPNFDAFRLEDWNNDKRYILQTITLPQTGWKLISVIPRNELLQELDIVKRLNIATYVIVISMLCLFLFICNTRILKPIKAIMDFMRSYPMIGQDSRFNAVYHNEIGVLALNLNKMLDDIEHLSSEVQQTQKRMYEIELARKQMEVASYRNQINPHFLYNTLECIRAIALYRNADEIVEITASLSNMFRYAVKGNDFVTVADEVSHVQEYAKIIEFRFNGRIRIEIEVQEDILAECMIKMLLQPIVENAVFHGLERKLGKGKVAIRILKLEEYKMQALITDNGFGMEEAKLQEVRTLLCESGILTHSEQDKSDSIGIQNIYRRLKLFYEEDGNMAIESIMNEGTTVVITFPITKKKTDKGGSTVCIMS